MRRDCAQLTVAALILLGSSYSVGQSSDESFRDEAFLRLAAQESQAPPAPSAPPGPANPDWNTPHGLGFSDPGGPHVITPQVGPTPSPGFGYAGVSPLNMAADSTPTTGPRFDTTFSVVRDFETAYMHSERQVTGLAGGTIIPFQTPCTIFGVRGMGGYADNMSNSSDVGVASIDAFIGTRYKSLYWKVGYLYDDFARFDKMGLTSSILTTLPILGVVSADTAYGLRTEEDAYDLGIRDPNTGRALRIESADADYQFRVGKFWSPVFQSGFTGNLYRFDWTEDDWGAGAFANVYAGRTRIGIDVTGGREGLRGYVKLAFSFGCHPCDRVHDCNFEGVDTIDWISRATDRDQSIRLRQSPTGPLPAAP